ncbi:hypothetical protein JL720_4187 [Aureococcus anophagefferens]|nr:hypothetical protein JL720_4187 [Aureococcus anophagefferens]
MGSFRPPAAALLLAALLCGAQPPSAEEGASSDAKDASSDEEGRGSSQQTLSSSETNRFCRLANSSGCWGRNRAYGDDALLTFADLNVTATYEPTRLRPALGDLDGDADLDLVVGASDVGDARDILGHRGDVFLFWNVGSALAPAFRWDDAFGYPFFPATVATENPPCAGAAAVVTCGCDFPCANVTGQLAPALADLDGDADLDLVLGSERVPPLPRERRRRRGAVLRRRERRRGRALRQRARRGLRGRRRGRYECPSPAFADFDGDGDYGASNGNLHYYVNEGNATAPRLVESDAVVFRRRRGLRGGRADADGDGDADAFLGEMMPYVNLARNVGSRYEPYFERPDDADEPLNNWAAATAYDDLTQAYAAPAVGDLDGDGLPDVLVGSVDGLVVLYLTTVSEAHYGETWEDLQADSPTLGVAFDWGVYPRMVDVDADGDLDVILSSAYGGAVYLLENDGGAASPHFALHGDGGANAAADAFAGKEHMALALGDVDGDADLDLVATYAPAFTPIVYFENGGNASRPAFVEAPSGQNPFDAVDAIHIDQTVLALYDVDADGDLDLLLAKLTGTAVYYANFGSSTAMDLVEDAEHGLNEASLGALATAPAVALGDLDGDGAAELLVGDQGGFLTYYANSYCQLASGDGACSLRGLCRAGDGRYAAAACECLSGTTGDQRGVPPGFWGADCDLSCPSPTTTLRSGGVACLDCVVGYYFDDVYYDREGRAAAAASGVQCDTLNMLVTGREDDFAEQEAEAGGAPPTWLVKVKIMLGLFQIVGAMPWSLPDVSFPARLLPVVAWANYLNFDLLSWVPMECFGRFGYFDQLGTYAALLLTFCVLPGCSSITFRFLSCARYDAGDYEDDLLVLHADPAVECRGDRWNAWRGYVGLMLCVYPVGIPLSYFCVLSPPARARPALDDDRECDAIRTRDRAGSGFDDVDDMFLVEEYEPRCYLFSVFECFRRVALTGGLTVFAFGGATQAAMGLLISLVSYKVYAVAAPFIEDDDDLVSEVAQLELVFVFFSALMLVVADTAEGETSHARAIFSAFLGLAFALGLAVVVDDDDDEEEDGAAPPPLRDGVFPWPPSSPRAPPAAPRSRAARRAKRRPAGAPAPAPDPDAPALSCWVGCFQPGDDALRALGPATVSVSAADDDADFARARPGPATRRSGGTRASALF